ncbi:hypothetical protein FKM82_000507 [Ascaphus truei]
MLSSSPPSSFHFPLFSPVSLPPYIFSLLISLLPRLFFFSLPTPVSLSLPPPLSDPYSLLIRSCSFTRTSCTFLHPHGQSWPAWCNSACPIPRF